MSETFEKSPKKPTRWAWVGPLKAWVLGVYFLAVGSVLFYLLYVSWPTGQTANGETVLRVQELDLLLLVMISGALGSFVHATTSFTTYMGNRSFVPSWSWWYVLRPFVGTALALLFYIVVRGGLLPTTIDNLQTSVFGFAALAGLAGMFSKQATDKLRETFDNLFRTRKGDDLRKDKLSDGLFAEDTMIPFDKIVAYSLEEGEVVGDIRISDLYDKLEGLVTRVPIFGPERRARYIIHGSLLYRFIADRSIHGEYDAATATLADLLAEPELETLVSRSFGFVALKDTLSDVKRKMEAIENCQDVFVTENGESDEPVQGWLTNVELTRHLGSGP